MAEVFVLLSGIVSGMSQRRLVSTKVSLIRFLRRLAVLFGSYVATSFAVLWLVKSLRISSVAAMMSPMLLGDSLAGGFWQIVSLRSSVSHLSILLLYLGLTTLGYFVLRPLQNHPRFVLWGSGTLYCAGLLDLISQGNTTVPNPNHYSLLAWQFLYAIGFVYGALPEPIRRSLLRHAYLLPLAICMQGLIFIVLGSWESPPLFLISKSSLGLLRFAHILSSAVIAESLMRSLSVPAILPWGRRILLCSQESLAVYCGGTLVVVMLSKYSYDSQTWTATLLLNLLAWAGCILIANFVHAVRIYVSRKHIDPQAEKPVVESLPA